MHRKNQGKDGKSAFLIYFDSVAIVPDSIEYREIRIDFCLQPACEFLAPLLSYAVKETSVEIPLQNWVQLQNKRFDIKVIKLNNILNSLLPDEIEYDNQIYKNPYKIN